MLYTAPHILQPAAGLHIVIASNDHNVDLLSLARRHGWQSGRRLNMVVTVLSGVTLGSRSRSSAALYLRDQSLPTGSKLHLINHGHISGAGGRGGWHHRAPQTGGTGIEVHASRGRLTVTIENHSGIYGGGGGGGCGKGNNGYRLDGAGGGGAGTVPGSGGEGGRFQHGSGWGGWNLVAGGKGGNLGESGATPRPNQNYKGAAAGYAIYSQVPVQFIRRGTVKGRTYYG